MSVRDEAKVSDWLVLPPESEVAIRNTEEVVKLVVPVMLPDNIRLAPLMVAVTASAVVPVAL